MTSVPVFAQRTVVWLVAVGGLSFFSAIGLIAFGEDLFPTTTAQANAFSYSAIGHKAFFATLQRLGIPVLVSRADTAAKAGERDLVIVAEPPGEMHDDAYLKELLEASNVLLVLPKWWAIPQAFNQSWAEEVVRVPLSEANKVLSVAVSGQVTAVQHEITWSSNRFGPAPALGEAQLMTASGLVPLIESNRGMLLGELGRSLGTVWVLSDPDLISNQGFKRGDNAVLAVGIVQALLPAGGTVIVDEVIHGFRRDPSLWRAVLEFPFIIVTVNALAAIVVLVWAATGRFGSPVPDAPPLKAGKLTLIENAAGLLQFGGHAAETLRRYLVLTFADVAHRVHAPAGLDAQTLDERLERIGRARRVRKAPAQLRREAEQALTSRPDDRRLLHVARDLHHWKQEMLHGPGLDPRDQRAAEAADTQGRRRPGRRH